ncbi:MAG: hypothetical protein ACYSTT_16575 [Planctomycetota bacterium]|jgi:hypothetical protein
MKSPLDNDLNKAYEAFGQNHDHLRQTLMASLPDRSKLRKQSSRITYVLQFMRSTILRNGVTKIAAAAVIVITIGLGVVLLDESIPSAYAIAQTIKALESVTAVHVIGTDWDGNRYEAWNKINPETGRSEWVCIDQTPHGYRIASRPDGSCVWDGNGNVVRYSNKQIASNDFRYSRVFEQIAEMMVELNEDEKITIQSEKDPFSDKSFIRIHVVTDLQDYKIYVDTESKLPVRLHFDRADNMQQIARTVDEIYYNEPLPEGMFDFEVPAKWYRDWNLLDDPTKGLAIGDLTHEQGAIKTAGEYWRAVIENNWDYADQLRPVADWKTDYHVERPAELIEIGQPRSERGCSGLVTPCIVRFADGKTQKIELVINYRQIAGHASCIIVATWGWPVILSD